MQWIKLPFPAGVAYIEQGLLKLVIRACIKHRRSSRVQKKLHGTISIYHRFIAKVLHGYKRNLRCTSQRIFKRWTIYLSVVPQDN